MALPWPPFGVIVRTPRLELRGATDEWLERLLPLVNIGVFNPAGPAPFEDPMSLYEAPPLREQCWLAAIWAGRARVDPDEWWRLYLVIVADDEPVGVQDLTGVRFRALGTVTTFSWLGRPHQGRGLGREARAAALHLAFVGLGAQRAESEAFEDNGPSNAISRSLGYEPNGYSWATRQGQPGTLSRWLLTRQRWEPHRRGDITIEGIAPLRPFLGLE